VAAVREVRDLGRKACDLVESGFEPLGQPRRHIGGRGHILQSDRAVGADDAKGPVGEFDVILGRFQRVRCDPMRLGNYLVGRDRRGAAAEHGGARGIGAAAVGCQIGVGMRHADVGLVEPKPMAQQDLVHRLVALAVRDRARDHRYRPAWVESHHYRLALRLRGLLDDVGKADASELPALARLLTAAFEPHVIRHLECPFEVLAELAAIGIGLAVRSPWILILVLPLAVTIRYGVVAREEAYLERRFGDAYRDYKARVRRWL
jgi:hypothetical protein